MRAALHLTVAAFALAALNVFGATLYVSLESTNPTQPFATWATAATNIQDAVDAAKAADTVLVTNGVYAVGERDGSRVTVTKAITLQSVNGPSLTSIDGGTLRDENGYIITERITCLFLGTKVILSGFTLTNGNDGYWFLYCGGVCCSSTNAIVTNCIITGNSGHYGGGAYGGTLRNCIITGNSAWDEGGGACGSTLSNCTVSNNWGFFGGGAGDCILYDCTLTDNTAVTGGGAWSCTLYNSRLTGNKAYMDWYAKYPAGRGGGASYCDLYNCTLTDNSAELMGGGAEGGNLYNCTLTGNSASYGGGGADGMLYNCTVVANQGGISGAAYNSILYYNSGGNYTTDTALTNCCTTPLPTNGVGNIDFDPQLASLSHLSANSPCRGAGNAAYASGTDIDGEPWANPPSIGCDEYSAGASTGPLEVNWVADYRAVKPGQPVSFTAFIDGRLTASLWDFGDGVLVTNQPYTCHAWAMPGDYRIVLWAYNESYPKGVSTAGNVHVALQPVLYVAANNASPAPPYISWSTAATNIQDAVDVAGPGTTVIVSNGLYATGGRDGSRVTVDRPLVLRSANGPLLTTIQGAGGVRCVFLGTNALLDGFTLANGSTSWDYTRPSNRLPGYGGAVACDSPSAVVSNCTLIGNSAWDGGGAYGGTLYNCAVSSNSAQFGGGASRSSLYNCTLMSNFSGSDGTFIDCTVTANAGGISGTAYNSHISGNSSGSDGAFIDCTVTANAGGISGTAYNSLITGNGGGSSGIFFNCTVVDNEGGISGAALNSIIYYNSGGNYAAGTLLHHCCTTPLPTNGVDNLLGPPLFMDRSTGDFRLWEGSPCIDVGLNLNGFTTATTNADGSINVLAYPYDPVDILGNTRFIDGDGDGIVAWDIGAYEFNSFKPPRFTAQPQLTPNGWTLNMTGPANKWVKVQRSGNLKDWEDIWSGFITAEGIQQVVDGDTSQQVMFYRAVVE